MICEHYMNNQTQPFFFPMNNVIQDYAWGSSTSIESLFGIENPSHKPQAELWMGAHPNGCSSATFNDESILLSDLINQDKASFLSSVTAEMFGELPYLFKVLAAEKALSIQVHPNKQQAVDGYNKEEQAGIPLTAFNRNYKDNNHKPELVYALTDYQAMNGFRDFNESISLFKSMNLKSITHFVSAFEEQPNSMGLNVFFKNILSLSDDKKETAINELMAYAKVQCDSPLFALLVDLEIQYPNDIGLFTPLMLNVITLKPGQAMYLHACTPHAYIKGTGLEIMANSDNVLRAGLTPKYMDIDELMACTLFNVTPFDSLLMTPEVIAGGVNYPIPVDDFNFSVLEMVNALPLNTTSAEVLFAINSDMTVTHISGQTVIVKKGHSVFIPAYTGQYILTSSGKVARAYN